MELWIIVGLWVLNFGISWWNAYVVGRMWVETKHMGGMPHFMAWMGGIMSASGFSWCFLIVLLGGAYVGQHSFLDPGQVLLTEKHIVGGFSLGYFIIVPAVLFSGTAIWLDSVVRAWRQRDPVSIGVGAWNTFAHAHNTYQAISGFGNAYKGVSDLFTIDTDDPRATLVLWGALLVVVLVIFAIAGGIMLTISLVRHYAATRPLPEEPADAQRLRRRTA